MRTLLSVMVVIAAASGCTRVVVVEAQMPPLMPVPREVQTVVTGAFTAAPETAPHLAETAAAALRREIRESTWYGAEARPNAGRMEVSGVVACRVTTSTVPRPDELDPGRTAQARSAQASVRFTVTAGESMTLFTLTKRPDGVRVRRRFAGQLPEPDALARALIEDCVAGFVADISPRLERVPVPRPRWPFGNDRTRRGIKALVSDPIAAIVDLTAAVERDPKDAAALNALGFCSEVTGNLDMALTSYLYAVAVHDREEYRANLERVHNLVERRNALLEAED